MVTVALPLSALMLIDEAKNLYFVSWRSHLSEHVSNYIALADTFLTLLKIAVS